MKSNIVAVLFLCFVTSSLFSATRMHLENEELHSTLLSEYENLFSGEVKPSLNSFLIGAAGYYKLQKEGKIQKPILSIADFTLSSKKERFWVINMEREEILYHTLVSHGQNTGGEFATNFSNESGSHKSSLGFYLTDHLYEGKHGLSMRIDGLEKNFNDRARERAIVFHSADYVSHEFARSNGRLGRSYGCPALPEELNEAILNDIKGKSCFFIYYPDENYLQHSEMLQSLSVRAIN